MFKRPLICTDMSDGMDRIAKLVPSLAESGMRSPTFLHVVPYEASSGYDMPREDEEKIEKAKKRLSPALDFSIDGVEVNVEVKSGRIQETVQSVAEQYNCDVVILGGASRSLLNERLFGSTTVALSQKLKCPLLILRPEFIATLTRAELELRCRDLCRTVLLPYNGSSNSDGLVSQFKDICKADREDGDDYIGCDRCVLIRIVAEPARNVSVDDNLLAEAKTSLVEAAKPLQELGLDVECQVKTGEFVSTLLDSAQGQDISAIVIASRKRNPILELSVPSKTNKILRRSLYPLLFFPST
ncbi:MAG: universal stress protein [Cyanobacteria bacterium P01_D01_bin.73]